MCNNDGEQACDTGEKNICFCSSVAAGFSAGNTHIDFQMVNGAFHAGSYFVKRNPFFGISLNAGEHAEPQILVSISGASFCSGRTGIVTITHVCSVFHVNPGANPFDAVSPSLFTGDAAILHGKGRGIGAGRIAVFIVPDFWDGAFISWVIRNESPGKGKVIEQHAISIYGIEGRITQKGIGMKARVEGKEIRKHRFQGSRIPNGFIFIGRIRFLFYSHFRMGSFKVIIEEGDVAYDAKAVGKDGKFIGVTEMSVNVLLFGVGTGGGL